MEAVAKVHVHPVVLLSIIDAYEKRPDFNDQIIGTLLGMLCYYKFTFITGTFEKGIIEVTHCFPVPHKVHKGEVSMRINFSQTMLGLERKVSRYSRPVGWFSTGSDVTEAAHLIHKDNYMKSLKNPIFLLVNPNLIVGEKMSIQAFQSHNIGVPYGTVGSIFLPLEVNLQFYDTERCAVDMMTGDVLNGGEDSSEPKCDLSYLYNLTNRLVALLEKINSKLEGYAKGEKESIDSGLGMAISRLLFATPKLDAENVEDLISSSFKDLLMVTYLTNMIRAHAKILSIAH
ncbi:unnamed protein product [Hymenolepis diminuta]|uniref:MPN domain-containing protein n=2 Tax=Hymenolepis diminuta TaxID=6216 RepID=A0A564YHH8_HYMDI|nr:unnamed protein product [Hymenolepis diminuta]